MRASCEASAETTDVEFLLQVEAARSHEEARWARSHKARLESANDEPFPIPGELPLWSTFPRISRQLEPLLKELGTWRVPATHAREAICLRLAVPLDMGLAPKRNSADFLEPLEDARVELIELAQWQHIQTVKRRERCMWGCFDAAQFPVPMSMSIDGCESLDPSTLRSPVHANANTLVTSIDDTGSAWAMMPPEAVVNAVPKDVFEEYAAGGFCSRVSETPQAFESTGPPEDWLCVICLDESCDGAILAMCGHTFHKACICAWFRKSARCPLCRRRCRIGPTVVSPPMVFDLEPWPMMPTGVIAQDIPTTAQESVAAARECKTLTLKKIEARRKKLADRFNCQVPSSSFFQDRLAQDEEMTGAAAVLARMARDRQESERIHQQLELEGQTLTSWPVHGRWPALPSSPDMASAHAALVGRLMKRHKQLRGQLQIQTPKDLARHLLKQCYKRAPDEDKQAVRMCLCSAPARTPLQMPDVMKPRACACPILSQDFTSLMPRATPNCTEATPTA